MSPLIELHEAVETCRHFAETFGEGVDFQQHGKASDEKLSSTETDSFSTLSQSQSQQNSQKRLKRTHGNERLQGYEFRRALRRLDRAVAAAKIYFEEQQEILHTSQGHGNLEASVAVAAIPASAVDDLMNILTCITPSFCNFQIYSDGSLSQNLTDNPMESIVTNCVELILHGTKLPLGNQHQHALLNQIAAFCEKLGERRAVQIWINSSIVDCFLEKSLELINSSLLCAQEQQHSAGDSNDPVLDADCDNLAHLANATLQCYMNRFSEAAKATQTTRESSQRLRQELLILGTTLLGFLQESLRLHQRSPGREVFEELMDAASTLLIDIVDMTIDSIDAYLTNVRGDVAMELTLEDVVDRSAVAVQLSEVLLAYDVHTIEYPFELQQAFLDSLSQLVVANRSKESSSAGCAYDLQRTVKDLCLRVFQMLAGEYQNVKYHPEWMQAATSFALLLANEEPMIPESQTIKETSESLEVLMRREGANSMELQKTFQLCALSNLCIPSLSQDPSGSSHVHEHDLHDEVQSRVLRSTSNPWSYVIAQKFL